MQVVDTVILAAFHNKSDPFYRKANEYLVEVSLRNDILVPSAALLEFDLELKAHSYGDDSRRELLSCLSGVVPHSRVLPLTPNMLKKAAELTKVATWRGSYFDTLIAATGLEYGADSVITTDRKFAKLGIKPVF